MPAAKNSPLINRIYNQDCVKGMKKVADKSVHLAFADPPFNIGYKYDVYEDRKESQQYVEWCSEWMSEVYRVLMCDGTFWLAIGDEYAAELKIAAQDVGFQLRSWVIWYYTFGVHCKNKFTRSHAHLFYFTKDNKSFTFNKEEIAVPSARQLVYGDKRANPTGRLPDDTWILRPQDARDAFQPTDDIWYIPRVNGTFKERAGFHGCQMPEQLLGRIVRACSHPGDVVLDPFSGSATTLVVAKKLGRQFVGFELSKDYAKLGTERLKRTAVGDKLEGVEDPKTSVLPTQVSTTKERPERSAQPSLTSHGTHRNLPLALARGFVQSILPPTFAREAKLLRMAFAKTCDGANIEQLVLDPVLNQAYQLACDELRVTLSPYERNRGLFRLRAHGTLYVATYRKQASKGSSKESKLLEPSVDAEDRMLFVDNANWYQMDAALHGIEIAWRRSIDEKPGLTLEELFSTPRRAAAFDTIAKALTRGFTATELRCNALYLRDELIKEKRRSATAGIKKSCDFSAMGAVSEKATAVVAAELPSSSGLYRLVDDAGNSIFQGATLNLARRIKMQLSARAWKRVETWAGPAESLTFEWVAFDISPTRPLMHHVYLNSTRASLLNLDTK